VQHRVTRWVESRRKDRSVPFVRFLVRELRPDPDSRTGYHVSWLPSGSCCLVATAAGDRLSSVHAALRRVCRDPVRVIGGELICLKQVV